MKERVRSELRALRESMARAEVLKRSSQIQARLLAMPEFKRARVVSFYVAKPGSGEVETELAIRASLREGKRVLVPIVDRARRRLMLSELLDPERELAPGAFGIPEPKPECRRLVKAGECELFVVPGIAFDLEGYRLGYGGGYYDVLLREAGEAHRVGLAYEFQVVKRLPRGEGDVRVHAVVTEHRVLRFHKSN